MAKCCETCVHWRQEWDGGDKAEYAYGACEYPVPVPYAWRRAPRERLYTSPQEGQECRCYAVLSARLPQVSSPCR